MRLAIAFYDMHDVSGLIIRIFCIGLAVSTCEYLYTIDQYANNGIFSWRIFKLTNNFTVSLLNRVDFAFRKTGLQLILLIRLAACVFLLIAPLTSCTAFFLLVILFASLLIIFRNIVGNDGSDQMNFVIGISMIIAFLSTDVSVIKACLFFICAQSILSYMVSGIAKGLSGKWRNGSAVFEIMNTKTYGSKQMSRYLSNAGRLVNLSANWNIILFESFFFLVLFLPAPYFYIFIVWGSLFHLYNAVFMGLNGFFWAFMATYPAIIYVHLAIAG